MADEEEWEWDSCCTRCYTLMGWDGDAPEVPEDAICIDCMWKELDEHRKAARENKMNSAEFAKRSEMYKARAEALDAAEHREQRIKRLLNIAQALLIIIAVVFSWSVMTAKVLVIGAAAFLFLRWVINIGLYLSFTHPTLKAIDEKFPKPETLDP